MSKESKEPKKRINSREKGADFERDMAKVLSGWWGEKFSRTPCSGGLNWKQDNRVIGDIVTPPDSLFPFSVELKKHEGWSLEQALKGVGDIESWWTQCARDANKAQLKPLLIFSKNFDDKYVMMIHSHFNAIMDKDNMCRHFILWDAGHPARVLFLLSDLMKITKNHILKTYSTRTPIKTEN